ncbi:AGAP010992-PA-like protein [Anopheles sinensis]|uniref:AGAP010992-PA-like protein n=1 Tax=Anopheles sinensis TaxID=74873 RepID=A0A084W993_ANOSI|nr:AGAP010992-PA-like protein [Anopheles sinensis]
MDIVNASASIRRIGTRGKYVADFTVAVFQTLTDLQVTTSYYIPAFDGSLDKAIYNRTVNFCTYLRRPGTERVLQMIYEDLNRRGNLPKSCPVLVTTYSFNTSFDSFRLPPFLPESKFRFDLNFHHAHEPYFESHWFGTLRKVST